MKSRKKVFNVDRKDLFDIYDYFCNHYVLKDDLGEKHFSIHGGGVFLRRSTEVKLTMNFNNISDDDMQHCLNIINSMLTNCKLVYNKNKGKGNKNDVV